MDVNARRGKQRFSMLLKHDIVSLNNITRISNIELIRAIVGTHLMKIKIQFKVVL